MSFVSGPIPGAQFDDNTDQRTPCVLVLDASGSMTEYDRIGKLNSGLKRFTATLKEDDIAKGRVQLCVVKVSSSAEVISDWCDAVYFTPPTLEASGTTALGRGVELALQKIEEQKEAYKLKGIPYTRPWIFILTDGEPTDERWREKAEMARAAERSNKVIIWPIGVGKFNLEQLKLFKDDGKVWTLEDENFQQFFVWLSNSMSAVSGSTPGGHIQIPAPPLSIPT